MYLVKEYLVDVYCVDGTGTGKFPVSDSGQACHGSSVGVWYLIRMSMIIWIVFLIIKGWAELN